MLMRTFGIATAFTLALGFTACDDGDDDDNTTSDGGSESAGDGDGDGDTGGDGDGDGDGDTAGDGDGDTAGDGDGDGDTAGDGDGDTAGDGDGDGDTGGGAEDDPDWPRPVDMMCDAEFAMLEGLNICLPPCTGGAMPGCPGTASGSAMGSCVYNPMNGMAMECTADEDCPDVAGGQTCQTNAGGGMSCLYPSTHCVLFCSVSMANCPDGMVCGALSMGSDDGFCAYAP